MRYLGRNGSIHYLARQLSSGRQVALRVCDPWPEYAESVQRHATLLARLDHPNILRVVEIGEVEGRVHVVMEYVSGRTLADRSREGTLSAPEAAALTRIIALTLEYARDQGMTHLNLMPNSIWLTDEGMPKLSDFQLMEVVEQWDERESAVTIRPAFSAPEEIARGRHSVSPTAAVYRVGAVMYTMLTGQPPFAGSALEIAMSVLDRPPPTTTKAKRSSLEGCGESLHEVPREAARTSVCLSSRTGRPSRTPYEDWLIPSSGPGTLCSWRRARH